VTRVARFWIRTPVMQLDTDEHHFTGDVSVTFLHEERGVDGRAEITLTRMVSRD
jgi:hypothetical protein